ncbi:MAG: Crp/Fnr family transcriptional regulator [Ignavibacteria bacterium]|nr:Crp/Fnr family transcriptional regulator [Ignavibacteria bacterium]
MPHNLLTKSLGFTESVSGEIEQIFSPMHLEAGEYFLKPHRPMDRIGIIISGVSRTFTVDEKGEEYNLVLSQEGNTLLGSFVPESSSDVYIQCLTNVEMQVAPVENFMDLLRQNNWVEQYFYSSMAKAHLRIQNRLTQYLRLNAKGRYLKFLEEYPNLINRIPHFHVANYLGITQTQLSRIRRTLLTAKN